MCVHSPSHRLSLTHSLPPTPSTDLQVKHNEQLRSIEARTQEKLQLLEELGEFTRKRAEIEGEYAAKLDRLVVSTCVCVCVCVYLY